MNRLRLAIILLLHIFTFILLQSVYAETFTNPSSNGGSVDRTPNKKVRKSCKDFTCGPTSTIKLSMASVTTNTGKYNYNTGENSTLEQMMKLGDSIKKHGPASLMNQQDVKDIWGQMGVQGDKDAKKEIRITFPMIDYGFSGTFNNIKISVTRPRNGQSYSSVTRGLTNKDRSNKEFTGTVTIEKYTPFVLKGSYSGPLMRYVPIPWKDARLVGRPDRSCPAFSDPSTPPCKIFELEGTGQISGQFNILSPWRDDKRLKKSIDHVTSYVDPLKNDIKGKMAEFGIDIDVEKEFAKAGFGSGNSSSGFGKAGSSRSSGSKDIYGGCNCSCNFVETATTQCKSSCSAAFSACMGERYTPPQKTVVNNSVTESLFPNLSSKQNLPKMKPGKLMGIDQNFVDKLEKGTIKVPDNIRSKYISALKKKMPGQANAPIREMMIKGFDEMPDNNAKLMMLKSVGGN